MGKSSPKKFFTLGPFKKAKENIEAFSYNIYMSQVLQDSWEKRKELEETYEKALRERDVDAIQELQHQLNLFDNSFALTAAMLENYSALN